MDSWEKGPLRGTDNTVQWHDRRGVNTFRQESLPATSHTSSLKVGLPFSLETDSCCLQRAAAMAVAERICFTHALCIENADNSHQSHKNTSVCKARRQIILDPTDLLLSVALGFF